MITPLHYLYAKFLVRRAARFKKTDWLHFLPFSIYQLYRLPQYWQSREELANLFVESPWA